MDVCFWGYASHTAHKEQRRKSIPTKTVSITGGHMTERHNTYDWDGFSINLYHDDDGDWLAHFVEIPTVSAFADTPEKALDSLYEAWEAVKECYREEGKSIPVAPSKKEYSGCFNVRIDKRIHRSLAIEAQQAGISLNALVAQRLSQRLAAQAQREYPL